MSAFNPDMLLMARESRGLTQTALAMKAGLAQGTVSKIEHKQIEPDDICVARLAGVLEYPPAFFSTDIEYRNLPVTFFRKKKSLGQPAVRSLTARINIVRLHVRKLMQSVDTPEDRVPRVNLAEYGGSVERVAREVRTQWHVPPGPIENVVKLLEDHGIIVLALKFDTEQMDAVSIFDARDGVPPIIILNLSPNIPWDRLRFTLVHELAHLVLHHHLPFPPPESETEADEFAAEFLMPAAEIRGHLGRITLDTLASLKMRWKVSMAALLRRSHDLGTISDYNYRRMHIVFSQTGMRRREPVDLPRDEPTLFHEIVKTHLSDLGFTPTELSCALLMNEQEFVDSYLRSETRLRVVK